MTIDWTQGALSEGLRLYNDAQYFEAHEAWESVWLTAPQPEKLFLQALIQIAVALHHFSRNNLLGTARLLTAALRKLEADPRDFANIDLVHLRADILDCLEALSQTTKPVILSAAKNPRICAATDPSLASAPFVPRLTPPRIRPL